MSSRSAACSVGKFGHRRLPIYMSNRFGASKRIGTEHLEQESEMLNLVSPYLRRFEYGTVYFESPQLIRMLTRHRRRRMAGLCLSDNDELAAVRRSTVSVMAGGDYDDFWFRYRDSDIAIASRFRSARNVDFRRVNALAVPHIMAGEDGSGGAAADATDNHAVLFVCYTKIRCIYMYDSLYSERSASHVPRLTVEDVTQKYLEILDALGSTTSSAEDEAPGDDERRYDLSSLIDYRWSSYGVRIAFHHLENYLHAMEIVAKGVVPGRNSEKKVTIKNSEQFGAYAPENFRFVHAGFGGGRIQRYSDCGLWVMAGMNDLARFWRTPGEPHRMRFDSTEERSFFMRPEFASSEYTAIAVVDIVRRHLLAWSSMSSIHMSRARVFVMCSSREESRQVILRDVIRYFKRACLAVFSKQEVSDPSKLIVETSVTQLCDRKSSDALVWITAYERGEQGDRAAYEILRKNLSRYRFVITVHPGQAIHVNYRKSVDDRRFCIRSCMNLVYSVPPNTKELRRCDEHTIVPSTLYSFGVDNSSQRNTMSVELPTVYTERVHWLPGIGWLCYTPTQRRPETASLSQK